MARGQIVTTLAAVNGGQELVMITDKDPAFKYVDGKKGEQEGWRITALLIGNRLQPLSVKIAGADPLPQLTSESIMENTAKRGYTYAKLTGAVVKLYTMNGNLGMTATATGVTLVASNKSA